MKEPEFQKLINKLDREIIRNNLIKRKSKFEGIKLIKINRNDSSKTLSLISRHNHLVRSYNKLGGDLMRSVQNAIDNNPMMVRPQDNIWGAMDELLRLDSMKNLPLFYEIEPNLHHIEARMKKIYNGKKGIKELKKQIFSSRNQSPHFQTSHKI